MKKILLTSLAAFLVCFAAHSQIVITEIMYNPPESGVDSLEYIELYNASAATVDISGWNFTQGVEHVFPTGTSMTAGQYIVLAVNPGYFNARFGFMPTLWTSGALTNGGEDIELRDAAGNVIDFVDYKNVAPWPTTPNGLGSSLSVCDPTADNSLPTSWVSCPTSAGFMTGGIAVFGDPGAGTTCSNNIDATTDFALSIAPAPVTINVLLNDYQPLPVTALTIEQAPAQGTAVVNANNTITFTPANNQCGPVSFTYKACAGANCDTAAVNVTVRCYPLRSIPEVSGINPTTGIVDSVGLACELTGTVLGVNLRPANGLQFTMVDGNSGIAVFRNTGSVGYTVNEKDIIKVKGVITQFNGLNEIVADTIIFVSANNPIPTPLVVQGPTETYESRLIKINNLVLADPATWTTGMGASGFTAKAVNSSSDTIQIRIDNDVTLYTEVAPTVAFDITGIGTQNDNSNPYTEGYQIMPRYLDDLDLILGSYEPLVANLSLTPNPSQHEMIFNSDVEIDQIRVYDAYGKLTVQRTLGANQTRIDVSTLPSGLYVLVAEKGGNLKAIKFVKL